MSTAARGTLGDGVRPASAMASRGLPRRRATYLGMAGRGCVQICRCVRAAGQPRHRMPLPLLLLHTAATFFELREIPAVAAFSVLLRLHDDLLLHTAATFSVLMQQHGNLLLHAAAACGLLFVKFNRIACSMATVASSCAPRAGGLHDKDGASESGFLGKMMRS
ncbi:hypothetical protein EJB05_26519, partial [Eragrostis curvula]